ncbi:uncharacterized protein LOC143919044 isoform X2 [Arctopsyche grandis]|uniref:uncharacterized protein LOC143919044 isoform X2 n=1 Tax=Arctopsyche grandis TaxID=121162 RepID=UPI00406D6AE1
MIKVVKLVCTTHPIKDMCCLRIAELRISPPAVQRGARATLECLYDLQGAPLYCVKWYRGRHEFYRYTPGDRPHARIFPFSGIYVDLSESNSTQVMLQKVGFALSGNFSCEVSADQTFSTAIASAHMEVVALPEGLPVIVTERPQYDPGDILRANCTAPPSRPLVNLTFLINAMQISPGLLRHQPADEGLHKAELSVSLLLLPEHYLDGPPILRCLARVLDLYNKVVELPLRESDGPPRIGRVTSSTGCKQSNVNYMTLAVMTIFYLIKFKCVT